MEEIKERGVIQRVAGRTATIKVMRHSACEHCESKGACDIFEGKEVFIDIPNELDAKPGDEVEISVSGGSLVKLSVMVYFLPIVALVVGAYLGGLLGPRIGLSASLASVLTGLSGMLATFLLLRIVDRSSGKREAYAPRMTRIIYSNTTISPGDNR